MATIWVAIFGNIPAPCIAAVRLVPVLTSVWIFFVASTYTALPDAPPTESSDSTRGTPAANIVAKVLVQRAMVALRMTSPKIGACNSVLSMKR